MWGVFILKMNKRLELHELLCSLLGSRHVYFQPPSNIKMTYPAIVYELDGMNETYADNAKYLYKKLYTITVIDKNPDSLIPDKIVGMRLSKFDRQYVSDNLYHTVFTVYY